MYSIRFEKTMELICKKVRQAKPDYIVELKQNYGGSKLATYGTMMRAGDTPYCPEGNFLRTAYIQSYTPYAANDYQTITNYDTMESAAKIIIKMLAVGIPTYSMNLAFYDHTGKLIREEDDVCLKDSIRVAQPAMLIKATCMK